MKEIVEVKTYKEYVDEIDLPNPKKIEAWECDNCGTLHKSHKKAFECCELE